MKKILSLFLCGVLLLGLFACGETDPTTSSGTGSETASSDGAVSSENGSGSVTDLKTDTDTDTDTDSASDSSSAVTPNVQLYDPSLERKVIMDDSGTKIIIADLNLCGEDPNDIVMEDCIVWEWDSAKATGAALQGKDIRIDESKLRYSEYWKKDVVIFCGSAGWVGIVDYETKELLFEDKPGYGPHSVELLPNGDLVVACSGNSTAENGRILYYPLTTGRTTAASTLALKSAHGICWDPTNEVLWVLGGDEIIACTVKGGNLSAVSGMGASLKKIGHGGGHDLVPVYGNPGRYWVSCSKAILQFDASKGTLTAGFSRSKDYNGASVKGIAWFPDGTMIITAHDQGGTGTYRSAEFRFLYLTMSSGKVKTPVVTEIVIPHREGSQTYKIRTLSKNYQ